MGNWIPGDPTLVGQVLKISAGYAPPPPEGFVSPMTWGKEEQVRERFGAAGVDPADIRCERATWVFRRPGAPAAFVEVFERSYGPTMDAFEAAEKEGRAAQLRADLLALFEAQNGGGPDETVIVATFLKVTVRKA